MKVVTVRNGFIIVTLLALSGALSGVGNQGWFGTEAASAASSGVFATLPGGMAMPKEARTSLAWYSRSFIRGI